MFVIRKANWSIRGRLIPLVIQETSDDLLRLHVKAQGACTGIYMLWQIIFGSILLAAHARGDEGTSPPFCKTYVQGMTQIHDRCGPPPPSF